MHAGQKSTVLEDLRRRLERLERSAGAKSKGAAVLPFGIAALDQCWPQGGLPRGAVHEVACDGAGVAAAMGFVAALAGRLARTVLWCPRDADLYAPGLAAVGLAPQRLIVARTRTDRDALTVMEEALRHGALGAVIGEIGRLDLTASRRLQLASEKTGTMMLILRQSDPSKALEPIASASRWRIAPLPSSPPPVAPERLAEFLHLPGRARWQLDLLRTRHGARGSWIVEAPDAQGDLRLPAHLADRSQVAAMEADPLVRAAG